MPFSAESKSQTAKTSIEQQEKVNDILDQVINAIKAEVNKGDSANGQVIAGYGAVLSSAANLQKSLPVTQTLTFSLTYKEVRALAAYALGGLILIIVFPFLTPWAGWKSADLVNLFLYWSGVVAVLFGASALPSLTGKGGSSSSNSSGSGGGSGSS